MQREKIEEILLPSIDKISGAITEAFLLAIGKAYHTGYTACENGQKRPTESALSGGIMEATLPDSSATGPDSLTHRPAPHSHTDPIVTAETLPRKSIPRTIRLYLFSPIARHDTDTFRTRQETAIVADATETSTVQAVEDFFFLQVCDNSGKILFSIPVAHMDMLGFFGGEKRCQIPIRIDAAGYIESFK